MVNSPITYSQTGKLFAFGFRSAIILVVLQQIREISCSNNSHAFHIVANHKVDHIRFALRLSCGRMKTIRKRGSGKKDEKNVSEWQKFCLGSGSLLHLAWMTGTVYRTVREWEMPFRIGRSLRFIQGYYHLEGEQGQRQWSMMKYALQRDCRPQVLLSLLTGVPFPYSLELCSHNVLILIQCSKRKTRSIGEFFAR